MKIAVTGGIGSGKSEVVKYLSAKGYDTLSADKLNSELLGSTEYIEKLKRLIPRAVKDGEVDRIKLAAAIFDDAALREKVNALAHPLIEQKIKKHFENSDKVYFVEVPLLFEADMQDIFDYVIAVNAETSVKLERLLKARGMNAENAQSVMNAQLSDRERDGLAHFIVDNNRDLDYLHKAVDGILSFLGV